MLPINNIRQIEQSLIALGSYPSIIQAMLDFDYLSGKKEPSLKAIIATGRRYERYFWGDREILVPVFSSLTSLPISIKETVNMFVSFVSARRVLQSTEEIFQTIPRLLGGCLFAEDVPEKHALALFTLSEKLGKFIIGPASIGLLLPGTLKLGAIGGTTYQQVVSGGILTPGTIAVFSASGGMTNEIINIITASNNGISFALSFGGDRFPITTPLDALLAAEQDKETTSIIYYGELGGFDEYEIAKLLEEKKLTKPIICYIAGDAGELFETPPQFGHAKAMAKTQKETASAKREALRKAGASVPESFNKFVQEIFTLPKSIVKERKEYSTMLNKMDSRKSALISSSVSKDSEGVATILGEDLLTFAKERTFGNIVSSLFLGKRNVSKEFTDFTDFVLRLLVDHGPYVSGAVNTIITARAGRDLVSSLTAGLLTIGPRFGGAINQAADNWTNGVLDDKKPSEFVEEFASKRKYIPGIGHKKYRIDFPDPRVAELLQFAETLDNKRFTRFALEIEKITTAKKGNLILNVDGVIAALLLDILSEKEHLSDEALQQLVEIEFFNSFFVLSRSVGFIAHFLDQKRLDEGLFRLTEEQVAEAELE